MMNSAFNSPFGVNISLADPATLGALPQAGCFGNQHNGYQSLKPEEVSKELRALISYGQLTNHAKELLMHLLQKHYLPNISSASMPEPGKPPCTLDFIPMGKIPNAPDILFVKRDPNEQLIRVYWTNSRMDMPTIFIATFDGDLKMVMPEMKPNEGGIAQPSITREDLAVMMYQDILKFYPGFEPPFHETPKEESAAQKKAWEVKVNVAFERRNFPELLLGELKKVHNLVVSEQIIELVMAEHDMKVILEDPKAKTNYLVVSGVDFEELRVFWGPVLEN